IVSHLDLSFVPCLYSLSATTTVICDVLLLITYPEPLALGIILFIVTDSFTYASLTYNFSSFMLKLFVAFATAESNTLEIIGDPAFGVNIKIALASLTFLPRIKSITSLAFLGAILTVLAIALASMIHTPYFLETFLSSFLCP